ncbi:MAG TPA: PQQ-binding-like beta-propeller repeat protein, partial [Polyangiaceae bacterium]
LSTDGNDNIFISGSLYNSITGLSHPLIAKLTPEGKLLWLREPGGLYRSVGVAVDANGNAVLVTEANEVLKYSPSGDVLWRLTPKDKTGATHPSVGVAGNILALTANTTSAFLTEWSANGDPISDEKLCPVDESPTDLAFDRTGDLLAVRYEAVTRRRILWRFSRASGVLWSTSLTDQLFTADRVALDARGRIFIVGMANDFGKPYYDSYLAQYDPDGKLLWGEALRARGNSSANSLLVSRDGKVFIAGGSVAGAFVMRVSPP